MAIRFYGDESEDKQEKVHALAGWLGFADEWDALQEEWVARVKPAGVSAYHMTDCECGRGEFRDWPKPKRTQLTIDLVEMICRYDVFLIGCGLLLDDFATVPPLTEDGGEVLGHDKWHLVFQAVLQQAANKVGAAPSEEKIAFFFDWKQKRGVAGDVFEHTRNEARLKPWRKRLDTLTFGHKEFDVPGSIPLLQVADIAAVETRKFIGNPMTHPHLSERRSFTRLREAGRVWSVKFLDKPVLDAIYESKRADLGLSNNENEAMSRLEQLKPLSAAKRREMSENRATGVNKP